MRKSALFVLVFIMALSAFSIGVGLSYENNLFADDDTETVGSTRADGDGKDKEKEEEVKDFTVKAVHYKVKAEGEVEVDDRGTDTTVIVIPKEVTYKKKTYKVTSIVERAFYQNTTLKSVTIEGGGTKIPKQAFEGCASLTTLIVGEGFTLRPAYLYDHQHERLCGIHPSHVTICHAEWRRGILHRTDDSVAFHSRHCGNRQCRSTDGLLFPHFVADDRYRRACRNNGNHPSRLHHLRHDRDRRECKNTAIRSINLKEPYA